MDSKITKSTEVLCNLNSDNTGKKHNIPHQFYHHHPNHHHRHHHIITMTMYNCTHNMMIIRAGMELGQVLSEEQRKERFSSSMRRKRAAAQEVEKITLMKKS